MTQLGFRIFVAFVAFFVGVGFVVWLRHYEQSFPVVTELDSPPCLRPPIYEAGVEPCQGVDYSALPELPTVTFCDLMATPEIYTNKIIQVKAQYIVWRHGTLLFDERCESLKTQTSVWFHPTTIKLLHEQLTEARDEAGLYVPFDVVATGRFMSNVPSEESDLTSDTAPFQFQVMSFEKVSVHPVSVNKK